MVHRFISNDREWRGVVEDMVVAVMLPEPSVKVKVSDVVHMSYC